jgi:hypothetical protein
VTACIGAPISWPRLESFALGAADPALETHLASCAACRGCLDHLRADEVALPPLVAAAPGFVTPAPRPAREPQPVAVRPWSRRWLRWLGPSHDARPAGEPRPAPRRRWLAPAFATAAAAAVLLVVLRPAPSPDSPVAARVAIKGVGELTLELVRERAGAIAFDARHYTPTDRWKIAVTCPPGAQPSPTSPPLPLWIAIFVADGLTVDHPLAPSQIACGNRVVVPGAFSITGDRVNRVCAQISAAPPSSASSDAATACLSLSPEPH